MSGSKLLHFIEAWLLLPIGIALFCFGVWCVGSIHYTLEVPLRMRQALTAVMLLLLLFGMFHRRAWWTLFLVELALCVRFALLTPEDRFKNVSWQTPWGRVPQIEQAGNVVSVGNVRDFHYRDEHNYTVRYRDMKLDRSKIQSLDVLFSHWDNIEAIAHTMLRFNFSDGQSLVVSMETRLPAGAEQGFVPGIYKQYELLMLLGTPEDLIGLRTDHRGETVYSYRTRATPEQLHAIFDKVMENAVRQEASPKFYNSVTENCTTSLAPLLRIINPRFKNDIRLLMNGFSDKLLYDAGYLEMHEGESFGSLRSRSYLPGRSRGGK